MIEFNGKHTTAKIMIDDVEESCMSQIVAMTNHRAFTNPIAIMPDCHSGKGSVIGFTMPLSNKVIPNVIGVDIGCGMLSFGFNPFDIEEFWRELDGEIRERIPFGLNIADNKKLRVSTEMFDKVARATGQDERYVKNSLGTLGGGNHFIEFGRDSNDRIWVTVHSGSRNFGYKICEYWQKQAFKTLENNRKIIFAMQKQDILEGPKDQIEKKLADLKIELGFGVQSGLEYLEGGQYTQYLEEMRVAQFFAHLNRKIIMEDIQVILENLYGFDEIVKVREVETIHNYISAEDHIIRKGAIASYKGKRMLIPLNMRDGVLLCEGKSNPEWNFSAPHGAGRLFSRAQAKVAIDIETFTDSMKNVFSTSVDLNTLDEAPMAYKDSEMIKKLIEPTASIIDTIVPILNLKDVGGDKPWKKEKKNA